MRILGIDPGSRLTGYGCIDWDKNRASLVTHGTLRLANTSGKATVPLEERLPSIYEGLTRIIQEFRPQVMAVEKVFFAKNAVSALKLGQARGAVILTGMIHQVKIAEYSPTEVKLAVVGHGQADKDQVAKMLQYMIGTQEFATSDASDAVALAICHAHKMRAPLANASSDYAKALQSASEGRSKKKLSLAESLGITTEQVVGRKRVTLR